MLFSLTSRIVSALAAFIYPGYASYKTLSQRPASEAELERWLMYWSVLGCIVGVEYLAEWLVSWIPLYTTFKAIFLLYLALPQTQGATYIYTVHLRPFFATHEQQIDATIAEIRGRAYRFVQEKARALWAAILGALAPGAAGVQEGAGAQPAGQTRQPSMVTPDQGPAALLSSLWTSYGPGIIAGGATLLRQSTAATLPSGTPGLGSTAQAANISAEERRRQLEAELASLSSPSSVPMPPANNPARPPSTPSSSGSSASVRERTISGKFEEIRGGEAEGYEVEEDFVGGFVKSEGSKRTSGWFAGWGGASSQGYERVKSE
ncbi:hypothetical protein BDN70DRAFT_870978 [Pholiota conissans]|uniref:Protein YOP1 n=1 Tax=Pholiota conissans TaxID=109636 RepID=A0A9P5ZEI3_9AGAR|nr:hypothetical protein BDN70DRAFT_870978 [Pholiota conissans]